MATHTSARQREETPHTTNSTKNLTGSTKAKTLNRHGPAKSTKTTISKALRRRAQAVIKDRSIDAQSRALIRYGLAINDPWLPELVRRVDAGEPIFDKEGRLIIKTSA